MSAPQDPTTRAARAGLGQPSEDGTDLAPPVHLSSVRAFAGLDAVSERIEGRGAYGRYGGTTVEQLEDALVDLERPDADAPPLIARTTSSGQAALLLGLLLTLSPSRRRVVVVRPCYGATDALVAGPLGNLGVQLTTVDLAMDDSNQGAHVSAVLDGDVAAVVTEVITNPLMSVVDVPAIAAAAHEVGAACYVDATLATPFLFRPLAHGADLVMHSLTKHLSGHSDVLGGVLLASTSHAASDWLDAYSRTLGLGIAPFTAWLALRGLRTAGMRVERGSATAVVLAGWFSNQPGVRAVHYPGRHGAGEDALASRLLPHGRGPMLSVELDGGLDAARQFIGRLEGVRLAPSLGDAATTVSHPALTSHRLLSREQRRALGIDEGLVRISVGIEAVADLQAEFATALGV